MPKRPPSRKRSPVLRMVAFPKTGSAHQVLEHLPETQNELEDVIVSKFVDALKRQTGQSPATPKRGNSWPDYETSDGKQEIGIEVVEVLNKDHRIKARIQEQYAKHVRFLIGDALPALYGLEVTLDDGYQEPPYPSLNTKEGRQLAVAIANDLRSCIGELRQISIGRIISRSWQGKSNQPRTGMWCIRRAPLSAGIPPTIRFQGTFPATEQINESLLLQAIEKKLAKNYTTYQRGELWLLAYSTEAWHFARAAGIVIAREALQRRRHPFQKAWQAFAIPERPAIIQQVWP